jgi:hypothetical protein
LHNATRSPQQMGGQGKPGAATPDFEVAE